MKTKEIEIVSKEAKGHVYFTITDKTGSVLKDITVSNNGIIIETTYNKKNGNPALLRRFETIGLVDQDEIDVLCEVNEILDEAPEGSEFVFFHYVLANPDGDGQYLALRYQRNTEGLQKLIDTNEDKIPVDGLVEEIEPYLKRIDELEPGIISDIKDGQKPFDDRFAKLDENQVSINIALTQFLAKTVLTKTQAETNKDQPKRLDITEAHIPIKPELLARSNSNFSKALYDFTEDDFTENPAIPGTENATRAYRADYYESNSTKLRRKKHVENKITLHKPSGEELLSKADFDKVTQYIDIKVPKTICQNESGLIWTKEDNEVLSGLLTGFLFLRSQFPDINYKDIELSFTLDDIATCMGYKSLPEKLKTQIIATLLKAEKIRITHDWQNEVEARGIQEEYKQAIDMYGNNIEYGKATSRLVNFEFVTIKNPKAPDHILPGGDKDTGLTDYEGKIGIRLITIPAPIVYPILTNQIVEIPVEWVNVQPCSKSPELKRIKWEFCRRLKTLIHFKIIEENSPVKKKKLRYSGNKYNPKDNFRKVILDDLLTKTGGYNMEPYTLGQLITVKDPKTHELIARKATVKDIRNRDGAIRRLRSRSMGHIDKLVDELKKLIPEFKGIEWKAEKGRQVFYFKVSL